MKTFENVEHMVYAYDKNDIATLVYKGGCIGKALDAYTFHVEQIGVFGVAWHKLTTLVNKKGKFVSGGGVSVFAKWELEL